MTDYPSYKNYDIQQTADLLKHLLPEYDWNNSAHLARTPERFVNMLAELTNVEPVNFTTFPNEGIDEMVIIKKLPFYSLCAHHIIPFFGFAHIAYVPGTKLAGLSKFARVVKQHARGLWVQEALNNNIAQYLKDRLDPQGVAVVMEAEHLCMTMRGVQVPGARTTTSSMLGVFADHSRQARSEFLSLINGGKA